MSFCRAAPEEIQWIGRLNEAKYRIFLFHFKLIKNRRRMAFGVCLNFWFLNRVQRRHAPHTAHSIENAAQLITEIPPANKLKILREISIFDFSVSKIGMFSSYESVRCERDSMLRCRFSSRSSNNRCYFRWLELRARTKRIFIIGCDGVMRSAHLICFECVRRPKQPDYKNKNKKNARGTSRVDRAECMNKDIGQIAINEMCYLRIS